MKIFYRFLLIGIFSFTFHAKAIDQQVMDVRYWDWGHTPFRESYQYDLLKLILEKTRDGYGDYSLQRITKSFTTARVRRELSRGKLFNVQVGPWRLVSEGLDPAIRIDIDVCKGLMGYRQLIIRSNNRQNFKKINDLEGLRRYTVGVGRGWVDVDIFLNNGFQVNNGANFDTLLPMLNMNRFDFVSLGVIEAKELANNTDFNTSLMIAEQPLIYMPLPFVFYVSVHEPLLAQRIEAGLKITMADGSFDSLFFEKFSPFVNFIRQNKNKFLFLSNQSLPEYMQIEPMLLNEE